MTKIKKGKHKLCNPFYLNIMLVDTGWIGADAPYSGSDNRNTAFDQRCKLYQYLLRKGSKYWSWDKLKTVRVDFFKI